MYQIDNQDIAILTRVNDLAAAWNLKPYDFVAHVDPHDDGYRLILCYDTPPRAESKKAAFTKMLDSLGIVGQDWAVEARSDKLIDLLDDAIRQAPRAGLKR